MRFSSLLIFLVAASPAGATCFVCDEVVELTNATADCFEKNFETLIDALQTAPAGRQTVNVGACDSNDEAARRDGLIEMGELPSQAEKRVKTVYILDMNSVVCLRKLLAEHDGDLDPSYTFDLVEMCNGQ